MSCSVCIFVLGSQGMGFIFSRRKDMLCIVVDESFQQRLGVMVYPRYFAEFNYEGGAFI